MSDQLDDQLNKTGHGSSSPGIIRESKRATPWKDAGAGQPWSSRTVFGYNQLLQEIDETEDRILNLIIQDPVGAAKSWIGRNHLMKYGFLMGQKEAEKAAECKLWKKDQYEYPCHFELADVLLEAPHIVAQLVAEEYFEGGPETTPFTPEAFLNVELDERERRLRLVGVRDPFATFERPDVVVEQYDEKGDVIATVNSNPEAPVSAPPVEGFQEVDDVLKEANDA